MTIKHWAVDVDLDEYDGKTRAAARLTKTDQTALVGTGMARRNPRDTEVAEIGDELATARALADLAHQLLEATARDIESITHRPAHISA